MYESESIQENETHKILWYFEVLMDHLILTRRPDPVLINKKKREFAVRWILTRCQTTG